MYYKAILTFPPGTTVLFSELVQKVLKQIFRAPKKTKSELPDRDYRKK